MKATGIVRKIDGLGRVVIPIEIRRLLDLKEKDPIEIFIDEDSIILKKYVQKCIFCGEDKQDLLKDFKENKVCSHCTQLLVEKSEKNKK